MKRILLPVIATIMAMANLSTSATIYTHSPIPGVYSTGVDNNGNPLPAGASDPHYALTASPAGATTPKVTAPFFMWSGGTGTSQWINHSGSTADSPSGYYTYSLTFSLAGFDPTSAVITGTWTSDNTAEIYLNGNPTGITHSTPWEFVTFDPFTLNSGFVAGENVLSFVVYNVPSTVSNPTGLQVNIQSATALVPEPAVTSLLFVGAFATAFYRRKSF